MRSNTQVDDSVTLKTSVSHWCEPRRGAGRMKKDREKPLTVNVAQVRNMTAKVHVARNRSRRKAALAICNFLRAFYRAVRIQKQNIHSQHSRMAHCDVFDLAKKRKK
jgi:hypothetical protein